MRDTGNFVHRARRAPLWTRTGSRTDCVIDFKQLEWLLHKSNGSEKGVSYCNPNKEAVIAIWCRQVGK